MGKGAAAAGANTTDDAAAAAAAADAGKTDEKAAAAATTDDAAKPAEKPAKQERTYTKAEMEAERQKAAADALKKANEEKDLSELEKAQKRIQELEATNRLRDAKESVIDALKKAGARTPELLWRSLQGELEFDDKGQIKNLDALVTNYKTDFADQFGEPKPDQTIDGGAGGGETSTTLTKEKLAKMKPSEIQQLDWEEVKKVMAGT